MADVGVTIAQGVAAVDEMFAEIAKVAVFEFVVAVADVLAVVVAAEVVEVVVVDVAGVDVDVADVDEGTFHSAILYY